MGVISDDITRAFHELGIKGEVRTGGHGHWGRDVGERGAEGGAWEEPGRRDEGGPPPNGKLGEGTELLRKFGDEREEGLGNWWGGSGMNADDPALPLLPLLPTLGDLMVGSPSRLERAPPAPLAIRGLWQ